MTRTVLSEHAPRPVGPYSQAVISGGLAFCSGQIGLDPSIGKIVAGGAAEETKQCLRNLSRVLEAAGCSVGDIVRTTIFVVDLASFREINEAYGSFFAGAPPARTTVQVAALPLGASVEIDAIAEVGAH